MKDKLLSLIEFFMIVTRRKLSEEQILMLVEEYERILNEENFPAGDIDVLINKIKNKYNKIPTLSELKETISEVRGIKKYDTSLQLREIPKRIIYLNEQLLNMAIDHYFDNIDNVEDMKKLYQYYQKQIKGVDHE